MALDRTETIVRLLSTDGLYYPVAMVDEGAGIRIPAADDTAGATASQWSYKFTTTDLELLEAFLILGQGSVDFVARRERKNKTRTWTQGR